MARTGWFSATPSASCVAKQRLWVKLFPFYVPDAFRPKANAQMVAQREQAKVIQFRAAEAKKPA